MTIPLLYSDKHLAHAPRVEFYHGKLLDYPEIPARVETIKDHLLRTDLVNLVEVQNTLPREAILKAHAEDMIELLEHAEAEIAKRQQGDGGVFYQLEKDNETYLYPSVFSARVVMERLHESGRGKFNYYFFDAGAPIGRHTWAAVLASATLAYEGANMIIQNQTKAAFALCRPPRHHAGRDFMGGYCYLNNACIAAYHLGQLGRVALLDIDYHHGNGSQAILQNEADILFGSIHAHPNEEYPYYAGFPDETADNLINLPLSGQVSAEEFLATLDQLIQRTLAFQPASIVVSLGFDTYAGDPLSSFNVTEAAYQEIGSRLGALGLPILLIQEGGYQVEALGRLAEYLLRGLTSHL